MPRSFASPLPLVASVVGLMLFMGGSQAALYRVATQEPTPKTPGEQQLRHCATAAQHLNAGKPHQAVALLQSQAHQPFQLPPEERESACFTPVGQLMSLTALLQAQARHNPPVAAACLKQCYTLSQRLRQTKQSDPELSLRVAERIESATRRTEASLAPPSQSPRHRFHRQPEARRVFRSAAS